jgi:hypothetical protein
MNIKKITKQQIKDATHSSKSMAQAARILCIDYKTFRKYSQLYGLWIPNQSGKGTSKNIIGKIPLSEILTGKHPSYKTSALKKRLIKAGIFEHKCYKCNTYKWMLLPIPLELHHKDGNNLNHILNNLEPLCPNCHAQTDNYRGKIGKIIK